MCPRLVDMCLPSQISEGGPPDSGPLVLLGDPHLASHLCSVQKRTHVDQDQRSVSAVAKLNFPPSYSGFSVPSHINLVFMKLQQV